MRWVGRRWLGGLAFVVLVAGSFGAPGCGGNACDSAHEALCKKACQCGACALTVEGGGAKIDFESEDDCVAFYGLVCDNDDTKDWDRCAVNAATAECEADAVVTPASCN